MTSIDLKIETLGKLSQQEIDNLVFEALSQAGYIMDDTGNA